MITEDYVSFEIAKLLKEKGFDEQCYAYYNIFYDNDGKDLKLWRKYPHRAQPNTDYLNVPTLQTAMKWLREVYGLFIRITEDITGNIFEWSVYQKNYGCKASTYVEDSYEKACEVAIKYCLEHLIQ